MAGSRTERDGTERRHADGRIGLYWDDFSPRLACRGTGRENACNAGCLPVISVAFCVRFAISVYINSADDIIGDTENDFDTFG